MNKKKLQALMVDFRQYAFILLAVSVFFYIGVVLPDEGKKEIYDIVLMFSTLFLLMGSFVCFKISLKYKKQSEELDKQE